MELANAVRPMYAGPMGTAYNGNNAMGQRVYRRPKPRYSVHFLKERREQAGLNQRELAELAGTTSQTVSRIETRQIQLTQETIDAFARALKIPRGALFDRPK